jgi:hypothetical protein
LRKWSAPALALLGYGLAFALLTAPLAAHPGSAVLSHWDADIEHSLWLQWWFATAVDSPEHALFHTDMVTFPYEANLQLADLNLAVNALLYGLGLVLGPAAAYNAALLLAFLAAGLATGRLARRLGASEGAAWLAGLLYAGSPYWLASAANGWVYLVHTWVLPVLLLALLRARDAPGAATGALAGLAVALCFHVTPYYLVYACGLLAVLLPWQLHVLRGWWRRPGAVPALASFAAVTLLLVAPRAIAMARAASVPLTVHHGPQNTVLGAPLLELVWPSTAAVEARLPRLGYLVVFLGYTSLATIAASLAIGARRRALAMWCTSAGALLVLALGPQLRFTDASVPGLALPSAWLQTLPVLRLTTNHWRWVLPAGLCLALAFSLAATELTRRAEAARAGAARLVLLGLGAALALEVAFVWPLPRAKPLWRVQPSPIAERLRDREDVHAVLDRSGRRKLNQTVHGRPIALGWLPRLDLRTQQANEAMVRACAGEPPACLLRYGIDAVIRDDETALLLREDGASEELRAP